MSTLTVYPDPDPETTSFDGYIQSSAPPNDFSTIHNSIFGNYTDAYSPMEVGVQAGYNQDQFEVFNRAMILFDTSALGSGATISSAVMSLYTSYITNGMGGTPSLDIVSTSPSTNTSMDGTYFFRFNYTSFSNKLFSAMTLNTYADFSLNSGGLSNINKTGVSKFGVLLGWDTNNSFGGTWSYYGDTQVNIESAENTGTSKDPKLVITYTTGGSGPTNIKTYMGTTAVNTKTIEGLAIASIKSCKGVS